MNSKLKYATSILIFMFIFFYYINSIKKTNSGELRNELIRSKNCLNFETEYV